MVDIGNRHRKRPSVQRLKRRTVLKTAAAAAVAGAVLPGTSAAEEADLSDDFGTGRELDDSVSGPAYGGGEEYVENNVDAGFTLDDADYVVTSASDFHDLFESKETGDNTQCNPQSGEVVYVPGNAKIELTTSDQQFVIPQGVTLASDRGVDGRPGGLVWTDDYRTGSWPYDPWLFLPSTDARVTGLRIRGRYYDWGPFDDSEAHSNYTGGYGIRIEDTNGSAVTGVEVDNCQVYGWAYAGVSLNDSADDAHVHHNDIHDTLRRGVGYGVAVESSGYAEIEYNTFNRNRHAIAASGESGNQYDAHHNVVGNYAISHVYDVHDPGGDTYNVYNNTIRSIYNNDRSDGKKTPGYLHRDAPSNLADVYDNWFYNPEEPKSSPTGGWTDEAIVQHNVTSWTNVQFSGNHYGDSQSPPTGVGAPASERVIFH